MIGNSSEDNSNDSGNISKLENRASTKEKIILSSLLVLYSEVNKISVGASRLSACPT